MKLRIVTYANKVFVIRTPKPREEQYMYRSYLYIYYFQLSKISFKDLVKRIT